MQEIVRPPTLSATVANAIRDAIIRGDIKPGSSLHEVELCQSLNTSRGTVREALRELTQEGLVEVFPHRGAFVSQLNPKRAKEIYKFRALLEPHAVRLGMERGAFTEQDFDEMRHLITLMGQLDEERENAELVSTDIQFHRLISGHCDFQLLLDTLSDLQSLTRLFIVNTKVYRSDMIRDDASHRAILQGILGNDPQTAEEIVRRHIIEAGKSLLNVMERRDGNGTAP